MNLKYMNTIFTRCGLTVLTTALLCCNTFSQDSVTVKDSYEIKLKAEKIVSGQFRDLLNFIATPDIEQKELKDIIFNAHSGDINKIFESANAIIEDDINPNYHDSKNTRDIQVAKYLTDLDLLYSKSNSSSIVLTIAGISSVKKSVNLYVKVYFTSFFRNASRTNDTPYTINNRVAEVVVRKENNRWKGYIARIGFFTPVDTTNDNLNDLVLLRDGNSPSFAADSASVANDEKSFEEQQKEIARKKEVEEDRKTTLQFEQYLRDGDNAFNIPDYAEAKKLYDLARKLRPYDPLPVAKINATLKAQERASRKKDDLFESEIANAKLAVKNRNYQEAITAYNSAKSLNPVEGAKYNAELNAVAEIYRNIEEYEEKYKAGLYEEAKKGYNALIKKNKNCSDYYVGRGKCYEKENENAKALEDYAKAYLIDHDNLKAILLRADLYKRTGDYFKALVDYKLYVAAYNQNITVYLEMADLKMLLNRKNIDEAIGFLDDGLKLPVGQKAPQLYLQKGLLLAEKNDVKNAEINFTSVVKIDSNHAFGYYNRGRCRLLLKQLSTASLDFESARQKGLDSQYIRLIEDFAAEYYQRSLSKFTDNAKDSALALINSAISINPNSDKYRFTKGEYYFSLGKYKEAIACYDQAVGLNSAYIDPHNKRGLGYYLLGNYKTAIESFTNALKLNPQLITAQKGIGDAYYALHEYANAGVNYESCIQTIGATKFNDNSFTAEVYNLLGKSYYHLNEFEKSIAALKSAIRKNNNLAEAYYNRGLSYYKSAQLSDAIEDIKKALSLENNHASWNYYLSKAYYDKKDYSNAILGYTTCLMLDSLHEFPDAFYLRGSSFYLLQNYQDALGDYVKTYTAKLDETIGSFNNELGNIYLNTGNYDSSLIFFNKAYLKDSANGNTTYGIACAYTLKNKIEDALPWFEKSFQSKLMKKNEIKRDKLIAVIQNDKRFKDLLGKYY